MSDPSELDKSALLRSLAAELSCQLAEAEARQRQSVADATHGEARAENSKDTRALETSYLARGLAQRVEELREAHARLLALKLRSFGDDDGVEVAALVALRDPEDAESLVFLLPAAGGETLSSGGFEIKVVTPSSPLGRALVGLQAGDSFVLSGTGRSQELEVVWVC